MLWKNTLHEQHLVIAHHHVVVIVSVMISLLSVSICHYGTVCLHNRQCFIIFSVMMSYRRCPDDSFVNFLNVVIVTFMMSLSSPSWCLNRSPLSWCFYSNCHKVCIPTLTVFISSLPCRDVFIVVGMSSSSLSIVVLVMLFPLLLHEPQCILRLAFCLLAFCAWVNINLEFTDLNDMEDFYFKHHCRWPMLQICTYLNH